jgi:integrase
VTGHEFTSAFDVQPGEYVAFKAGMGLRGQSRIWYLRKFDAYCAERGLAFFDRDTVEGWVTGQIATARQHRGWLSYIRDFGRWLRARGHADAYVLSDKWKAVSAPARPYLLTNHEIEAFFTAATRLEIRSPWQWQAPAFFTLMHSCGIRTCEARNLLAGHVDLPGRHFDVLWSKTNRSRRLPITGDVTEILAACDKESRARFGPTQETFFISSTGRPVTGDAVGKVFNRIWDAASLPRPAGGNRPRPYDFRHHFAYANIERWMAQGIDVAAMLPYLSTYMGHAAVESTFYYIHTSPDFMQTYAHITAETGSLLPEVGFE